MWIKTQNEALLNADEFQSITKYRDNIGYADGKTIVGWSITGWMGEEMFILWQCEEEEESTCKMEVIDNALRCGARYVDLETGAIFGSE